MVMAAELSHRLGLASKTFVDRLTVLIQRAGLPVRGPLLPPTHLSAHNADAYLAHMRLDKKSEGGSIKFILVNDSGQATLQTAPDELVREVIDCCCGEGQAGD